MAATGRTGGVAPAGRRAQTCVTSRWTVTVVDRSDVLIIRVWVEDGMDAFRGRLTRLRPGREDGATDDPIYALASAPSDVLDAVRKWLESFEQGASDRLDS
jgi:hypothetical protein